tara:strand:- start:1356 stop:1655 length:300 start_codon:yes stop_codon:yes gene_type:complete
MRKSKLRKMYFDIYMRYTNNDNTLEDIGLRYKITKQRVWQIVRFCKLGNGNYHEGLRRYNGAYNKIKHARPESDSKEINGLLREWLRINDVRLIKSKYG